MTVPLVIGLIGAGRIGCVHAKNIQQHPNTRLYAIADVCPDRASQLSQAYGVKSITPKALLLDPHCQAVIIASATESHAPLTIEAIKAGKAVFCEKPLDLNLERAAQVAQTALIERSPVFVGFNRRFDPVFSTLKRDIAAGRIGQLEQLTVISRDPSPPPVNYLQQSGGLFRDMTIHDFDIIRFLLDDDPCELFAQGNCLFSQAAHQVKDIDTATLTLRTKKGVQVQILNSRRTSYGYDQRIEAFGSKGIIQAQNPLQSSLEYWSTSGITQAPPLPFFMERYEKSYEKELDYFINSIQNVDTLTPSAVDGVAALFLAQKAYESLNSNNVVHFDLEAQVSELIAKTHESG